MASSSLASPALPRAFQFRLGTLLIVTAWAGFVSLGLSTPIPLFSGMIGAVTLVANLGAILLAIYRTGRTRAMAIGFALFSGGYLMCHSGWPYMPTQSTILGLFASLYYALHGVISPNPDPFGSYLVSNNDPSYAFASVCHHTFATLLGCAGGIAAQILFATQPRDTSQ